MNISGIKLAFIWKNIGTMTNKLYSSFMLKIPSGFMVTIKITAGAFNEVVEVIQIRSKPSVPNYLQLPVIFAVVVENYCLPLS